MHNRQAALLNFPFKIRKRSFHNSIEILMKSNIRWGLFGTLTMDESLLSVWDDCELLAERAEGKQKNRFYEHGLISFKSMTKKSSRMPEQNKTEQKSQHKMPESLLDELDRIESNRCTHFALSLEAFNQLLYVFRKYELFDPVRW